MKKIIVITILLLTVIGLTFGFSQTIKFETYNVVVNTSSLKTYENQSGGIDSTTAQITAYFGIVGNPYAKSNEDFTKYILLNITLKGDARVSDFAKQAFVVAEAYRKKYFPDIP